MIRRNASDPVRRAMADTPVVLINGARPTGKTTLVQAIAAQSGARYFTLDDAATLALAVGDPAGFIRNLQGPVVLDEIQKAPDLFPAIKPAVDRNRQPGRFLLTGSANVMTLPRLYESLAAADFGALKALQGQLGKRFRAGAVRYLRDQILPSGDKLWLVPVPALWAP